MVKKVVITSGKLFFMIPELPSSGVDRKEGKVVCDFRLNTNANKA